MKDNDLMADLEPNLGFASYSLALEFKQIKEYDLAADNFKLAQSYLPNDSNLNEVIPHQLASLEDKQPQNK